MDMGKAARFVGVDRGTLRNWVERPELQNLFSPSTREPNSRQFDERDLFVANTINRLREQRMEWVDIAEKIRGGYLDTNLSPGAVEVDSGLSMLQATSKMIELRSQVDFLKAQLDEQRERYEGELRRERDEIRRLEREIGRLEGKLGS
jgi:DNA-binding transcriptional MerR regulator